MAGKACFPSRRSEWRQRTGADVFTEATFAAKKARESLYVVGVMGFAGKWERSGFAEDDLLWFVEEARTALRGELLALARSHADRLVVATGGTNSGVLELTYSLCAELGITAMGITPDRALNYELGAMAYVLPVGRYFGDESDVFVRQCDAFLLLGGGKQSQKETLAAAALGKPIVVIQGFGGVADEFTPEQLPAARFV